VATDRSKGTSPAPVCQVYDKDYTEKKKRHDEAAAKTKMTPDMFLPGEYLGTSKKGLVTHLHPRAFKASWDAELKDLESVQKSRSMKVKLSTEEKHQLRRVLTSHVIKNCIAKLALQDPVSDK